MVLGATQLRKKLKEFNFMESLGVGREKTKRGGSFFETEQEHGRIMCVVLCWVGFLRD